VSCPAPLQCVAVGAGDAIATTDGGRTWSVQGGGPSVGSSDPGNDAYGESATFKGVACVSAGVCRATVNVAGGRIGYGEIVSGEGLGTVEYQETGTPSMGTITCPSATSCYAMAGVNDFPIGVILATTDGGSTWTRQPTPLDVGS